MSAKPNNISSLFLKVARNDQSKIVSFNVKYYSVVCYNTSIAVNSFKLIKTIETTFCKLPDKSEFFALGYVLM
jgi:hypothetical protein